MTQVPNNFGGLSEEFSSYDKSKIVILPVPYDETRDWIVGKDWEKMDASQGPQAIIAASRNMELYDLSTDSETYLQGIHTLSAIKVKKDPEETIKLIETEAFKHIRRNKFVVMLGGEHSISTGLVKALHHKFPKMSVLQIDAHSDLRDDWEDGGPYSHASVMARITEICPAVQVGIRSMCVEESKKIKQGNYNIFYAKDIHDHNQWMEQAISKLTDDVFITIDLDGLDPSIMPSTGTPVPGGLQWYQTLKFLKKVFQKKNVIGFDVVELAPNPGNVSPDFLAAKLTYTLLSYKFGGK